MVDAYRPSKPSCPGMYWCLPGPEGLRGKIPRLFSQPFEVEPKGRAEVVSLGVLRSRAALRPHGSL